MGQDKEAEKHLFLNVLAGRRDSAPGLFVRYSFFLPPILRQDPRLTDCCPARTPFTIQRGHNPGTDRVSRFMKWGGRKMGVAGGSRRLGVPQQGANNRKAQTVGRANAGIAMSKIVQAQSIDLGDLAYALPALSQRDNRFPRTVAREYVFRPGHSGQRADKFGGGCRQEHGLGTRLAIGKKQQPPLEIHVFPA